MNISFQSMQLSDDERTVQIAARLGNDAVEIKLSILQLAKLYQADKAVLQRLEQEWHGSAVLEDACDETRDLIKRFPEIPTRNNKIVCQYTSVKEDAVAGVTFVYAEDIAGWDNEGICIKLPLDRDTSALKGKKFNVVLQEKAIEFVESET